MYHYHGFPYLNKSKWVQVKGQPAADGSFTALEITVAADEDEKFIRLQGVIQSINLQASMIYLSNIAVKVDASEKIHLRDGTHRSADELAIGDVLRIDGRYDSQGVLIPERLSLQKKLDFNLDKLFGCIETVNEEQKSFQMFGVPIAVSSDTSIELTEQL